MATKNKAVDAYIAKSADFAKPILTHLRELVHKACPDVVETIKWGTPSFEYKGILCGFASFKAHCSFGFWKASLMKDNELLLSNAKSEAAMGHLGKLTSLKDVPSDKRITAWIKDAMRLNDEGVKVEKKKPVTQKELEIPGYFTKAVQKNKKAWKLFEAFSPSNKKEYVLWVDEAKTEDTRNKRLEQAIEWMAEGKPRNWKYMKEYR
ncbi:MAG: YdeI/OmpD-associated family protein [Flavihumibacter sp.]|nr:YdeI/OmpD-associated family protein [Flavihumibacter sp.]